MNISVKNLYVDVGAIRVKVQIGVTNIKGGEILMTELRVELSLS